MSTHQVTTKWLGNRTFESTNPGGMIKIDSDTEFGGNNDGLRPKAMMLASLAGCSGIDIASLVEKMRAEIDTFTIDVEGDLTEEHPKFYHTVRVAYNFFGNDLDQTKLQKIVDLSVEKYCGVMEMFRHFAKIEVKINYFNP